ncbi:hypothetical protein NC653_022311 [Populus alba x Populus x berolinensis]|uniref:Uncharacterized protein n=1 Tax=Populus alba x Populus x berolinensis TaxID=444605 RepID=A0AAD6MEY1_9ROSI|nr:hypothetical protein NC653_022311 [Populus alba x Populus x berolinensis]
MIGLGSVPNPGTLGRALARPNCYYQAPGTLGLTSTMFKALGPSSQPRLRHHEFDKHIRTKSFELGWHLDLEASQVQDNMGLTLLPKQSFNNSSIRSDSLIKAVPTKFHIEASEDTESTSSSEEEAEEGQEEEKAVFYGLRENPKRCTRLVDPEFSFAAVYTGSVVLQDRESETESSKNPTRRRSKRTKSLLDPEFSFAAVDTGSVVLQDRESETESSNLFHF